MIVYELFSRILVYALCLCVVYGKYKRLRYPHKPQTDLCSLVIFSILIFCFLFTALKKKRLHRGYSVKSYKVYYKHNPGHFELLIAVICYRSQVCTYEDMPFL